MVRQSIIYLATASLLLIAPDARAAFTVPFTITLSETVLVTGAPQIAVDVGGTTRYAAYSSGSGTNTLTFTLSPQAGDVDLDGITVSSPIDLNGGSIKDTAGNDLAPLSFTPPNTTGIKIDYPSLSMDFVYDADGRYTLNGTAYNDLTSFLSASGGTFSRASIGSYYDSAGILQTASSGTPRFDWDPVTHVAKGILIEESRTNLFPYSAAFNTGWTLNNSTITADTALAPDNTISADKLIANTSNANHSTYRTIGATGSTYTLSVYAKKAEMSWLKLQYYTYYANFDLNSGTKGLLNGTSSSIQDVGNGWYRCSFSFLSSNASNAEIKLTTGDTSGVNPLFAGNNTDGLYIWGAQLELGSFLTTYIPTTSAAVVRNEENLSIPTGSWYNSAAGTASGDYTPNGIGSSSVAGLYYFASASYSNDAATTRLGNTGNVHSAFSNSSGTIYISSLIGATGVSVGTRIKTAQTIKSGDYALSVNGGAVASNTATSLPSPTRVDIGSRSSGGQKANGPIRKFAYYPLRVSDVQLRLLTQ